MRAVLVAQTEAGSPSIEMIRSNASESGRAGWRTKRLGWIKNTQIEAIAIK